MKALTILGVSFGLSWSINAAVPAAIGVETDVPLIRITFIVGAVPLADASSDGVVVTRRLFCACANTRLLPGATRSGFNKLS